MQNQSPLSHQDQFAMLCKKIQQTFVNEEQIWTEVVFWMVSYGGQTWPAVAALSMFKDDEDAFKAMVKKIYDKSQMRL